MIVPQLFQLDCKATKVLSMEFFLHEYVKAFSIVARLENALPQAVARDLEKLSCDPVHHPLQLPGILDRLCSYSEALIDTSQLGETLHDAVDDLRILVSKQRVQMGRRKEKAPSFSLEDLQRKLRALYPLLEKILQDYQDSSPVLFTLLELRQSLNRHLGACCVEQLLKKLFPAGPASLRNFLLKSFTRRGFENVIQSRESLFEGLSW